MNDYSDLLFARPSFLEGVARVLDLGSTLNEYNCSMTPEQADQLALRSDLQRIGSDARCVALKWEPEEQG